MTAPELLRSLGLLVDGPTRWGDKVPTNKPGVFIVELPAPLPFAPIDITQLRAWIERVPTLRLDGVLPTPNALADRIRSYWVPDQGVLFIGSTKGSLGARVRAIHETRLGDPRPNPAAHWLLTLSGLDRARVWWSETEAAQEHEDALLDAFAAGVPAEARAGLREPDLVLPFAVLRTPTGARRTHGITGALLSDDAVATARSKAKAPAQPRASAPRAARTTPSAASRRAADAHAAAAGPRSVPVELSSEGIEALEAELRELREVRRPQMVKLVAAARELGDLRENAEYQTSRQELGFIDGRIQLLDGRLRNAVAVERPTGTTASIGSTVIVLNGDATLEYRLVDSSEADPAAGRVSTSSPVGKALVGKSKGDQVAVVTPGGQQLFEIVEVR
jgi:transcription elongation factor GreA